MKYTAAAIILASAVLGADSQMIPSGISSGCTDFLSTLNQDTTLQSCVNPLVTATEKFSPTGNAQPTTDDVNFALAKMCQDKTCKQDYTIDRLGSFYQACRSEIDGGNKEVSALYDILYVFSPLKEAVCAVDSRNQDYCVNQIRKAKADAAGGGSNLASGSTNPAVAMAHLAYDNLFETFGTIKKRVLGTRAEANTQSLSSIVTPNATTYKNTNLPFLFLQPSMNNAQLCTPCTRQIMASYIKFENAIAYGPGLGNSPILGGQSELWGGISNVCGKSYTDAILSEAGGQTASGAVSRIAAPAVGVVAGAAALALLL